jgi:transcriptional regulator with XRE-family HTH domain
VSDAARSADITGLPGLRAARQARGLSQRGLGKVSGVDASTICHLETAVRDARGVTLRRLAAVLGVPPAQLLLGDDYPAPVSAPQPPPAPTVTPARTRRSASEGRKETPGVRRPHRSP